MLLFLPIQLLQEMTDITVEHETLSTKNQLIISSYEGHLGTLGTNLKNAEHESEEQAHVIKNLESTKQELVKNETKMKQK